MLRVTKEFLICGTSELCRFARNWEARVRIFPNYKMEEGGGGKLKSVVGFIGVI